MKSISSPQWLRRLDLQFATRGKAVVYGVIGIAGGLCLATAALVWLGYVATREWQRGSEALLERRQAEAVALVGAALDRDMKGASASLLIPTNPAMLEEDPPYDLQQLTARTFARFPYPESLIVWKAGETGRDAVYALNRAERRPAWDDSPESEEPFPIVIKANPAALAPLLTAILNAHTPAHSFAAISTTLGGAPYQAIVHYVMEPRPPYRLSSFAALTVNLNWVRREYFGPVLQQTATIGGNADLLSFAVTDASQGGVAAVGRPQSDSKDFQRAFALVFIDRALLSGSDLSDPIQNWTVHVRTSDDQTLSSAAQGARRTFLLIALSALVTIAALLVTVRAVEARAALATMKSDFVSAVTHDLKTPVALIRLVGDTLASKRYASPDAIADYARLLSQEAKRLSQSIDQLLAYARYSDAQRKDSFTFSSLDLAQLVDHGLENLRPTLSAAGFDVETDFPPDLPPVIADAQSLTRVVENIIDNTVKYAGAHPALRISARANGKYIRLAFADRGIGIPADDLKHVFDRFYRARNATSSGSGLGLAIAKRIVELHGGRIGVTSVIDAGTEVELWLPSGTT